MPRPKRQLHATAALTTSPPASLPADHSLARVIKAAGNNLYSVEYPASASSITNDVESDTGTIGVGDTAVPMPPVLVELPARFRNVIWLKRGSFVVVDTAAFAERENKLGGEIVNVVREERLWRKMGYWPTEWAKKETGVVDGEESEEESVVGKMPPGSDEEDE